jgi:ACS family tartrate transporter-like MFS transporter
MNPLYRKIARRLVPFLILLYLIAFLDRVNIGFAALTMNRDLNIDPGLFGLAAGMFFIGYFFFEVPSNLMLLRFGARRWIMVLMIVWGVISVATVFVPGPTSYIVLRFLLGAAEAGFYPGVILYLTFWLPPSVRSGVMAMFITANPLSNVIGAPLSAQILLLDHVAGLKGWQWLFVIEGAPAILLGALVYFLLPDSPDDAKWLTAEDKRMLQNDLSAAVPAHTGKKHSLLDAFTAQPRVYAWSLAYFLLMLGNYVLNFWIPTVLTSLGVGLMRLGWVTALPYCAAVISMVLWSRRSDRRNERRVHLAACYVVAAGGFLLAALASSPTIAIAGFSLAAIGVLSALPVFWSASTLELAGPMVAAHIAVINSIGNLGGFFGPILMGWLRQATHHYFAGLVVIAVCSACGAFCAARLCKPGIGVSGAVATATSESAQP